MLTTNLTVLEDTDLYAHTSARLTSLSRNPLAESAMRMLKLMASRPILDSELMEASRVALENLRSYLRPQASSDYWYDSFAGLNGEVDPHDMDSIAELTEERSMQVRYLDACLARLN